MSNSAADKLLTHSFGLLSADDSDDVERECQQLVTLIEQYLGEGESLQQYF